MKYYVVWPDGQKFGPADEATLAHWALEGRIFADSQLEVEGTGEIMTAGSLAGLVFPEPASEPAPVVVPEPAKEIESSGEPRQDVDPDPVPHYSHSGEAAPIPTPSAFTQGRHMKAAWPLIIGGFASTFVFVCCCNLLQVVSVGLTAAGIYQANQGVRAGEEGAQTARTVGIVFLVIQVLMIGGMIALYALVGFGNMLGPGSRVMP